MSNVVDGRHDIFSFKTKLIFNIRKQNVFDRIKQLYSKMYLNLVRILYPSTSKYKNVN